MDTTSTHWTRILYFNVSAPTPLRVLISMARAIGVAARRSLASYRKMRKAKAAYDALAQLDDRMLRDLGFHRDELASVAAEFSGQAQRTRVRTQFPHGPG